MVNDVLCVIGVDLCRVAWPAVPAFMGRGAISNATNGIVGHGLRLRGFIVLFAVEGFRRGADGAAIVCLGQRHILSC